MADSDQDKLKKNKEHPDDSSRRNLLKGAGLFGAAIAGGASGQVLAQDGASNNGIQPNPLREALEVLTREESQTLEALCDTLIPSDEHGPGAKEARAAHYIDKSLASHNQQDRDHYLLSLQAINDYSLTRHGAIYYQLDENKREQVLQALQDNDIANCSPGSAAFFNLLRSQTIDGTFCDPYYGGNRNFVGWDLLRYPGIRLTASEAEVAAGASLTPTHQSAYDHSAYTKTSVGAGVGEGHDE